MEENKEIVFQIEVIDKLILQFEKQVDEKSAGWDLTKPYNEYMAFIEPENEMLSNLYRQRRMIMPYELTDLPNYGHIMTLKSFIKDVKAGNFIDYDGYGRYVKDNKETNIMILPSDIMHKSIRKDFYTIVWYNR